MRESSRETESPGVTNHHQFLHEMLHSDPPSSHEEFLHQILLSTPPFPWADDQPPPEDHSTIGAAAAARALILQQQLLLSRGCAAAGAPMHHADQNDAVDFPPNSANQANDASINGMFNAFNGSSAQTPNSLLHGGAMQQQSQSLGGAAVVAQPKHKVRARRGQATDPHSIAERLRRERIAERMKSLQELVPNANKTDKASMLDEIIDYVKFLQLQVKVLSVSRLGGAAAAPLVPEGNGMQTASSSEQQVAKLLEEDMGSAMQYLQGKGLCLMPISLATAISTATSNSRNPPLPPPGGPLSPSTSIMTVQSATIGSGKVDGTAAAKVERSI